MNIESTDVCRLKLKCPRNHGNQFWHFKDVSLQKPWPNFFGPPCIKQHMRQNSVLATSSHEWHVIVGYSKSRVAVR